MRLSTILALCSACLLCVATASSQPPDADAVSPTLTARMEADGHGHSFTVRFFLKNNTDRDVDVEYGKGRSGLEVVPRFYLKDRSYRVINPPTYLGPSNRALRPDLMRIPAGKEVLYGTFTMGYPPLLPRELREIEFEGVINFPKPNLTLRTEPVRLTLPAPMRSGKAITGDDPSQVAGSPGQWVTSDDGDLSIRLSVKSPRIAAKENISLIVQIRNNETHPVTVLRPFGDHEAQGFYLKIWGKNGRIKYAGPEFDYDLDARDFITLGPGEIVTDTLEVSSDFFAGVDQAGTYTLRFDYRYDGGWDKKVGLKGAKYIWRGWICTREVSVERE